MTAMELEAKLEFAVSVSELKDLASEAKVTQTTMTTAAKMPPMMANQNQPECLAGGGGG